MGEAAFAQVGQTVKAGDVFTVADCYAVNPQTRESTGSLFQFVALADVTQTVQAAGVLQAARRAGLTVPEDLTVVGFDDFQIAQAVWPPLTTVRLPIAARDELVNGLTTEEIRNLKPGQALSGAGRKEFPFLVNQPEAVKKAYCEAMGLV